MRAHARLEALLDCLVDAGPLPLGALAERVDLPKPTVLRLLGTLEASGWVTKDRQGTYALGPTLAVFARRYLERDSLVACAMPLMEALRDEFEETVSLSVRTGTSRIYIAEHPSKQSMRFVHELRKREPLHAGASGRVLMAWLDAETREAVYREGLKRFTDATITDIERLEADLAEVREQRWAISFGERSAGAVGLAVPLVDPSTEVLHALAVFTPAPRFDPARREEWIEKLRRCAEEIIEARRLDGALPVSRRTKRTQV